MTGTASCTGSRAACSARSARNAALPMSSSEVGERALRGCGDDRLERGQHALAVGLAERNRAARRRRSDWRRRRADRRAARARPRCRGRRPRRRPRPDRRPARPRPRASRSSAAHGQAARVASTKARPCAVVSRWRSFEGAKRRGKFGDRAQRRDRPRRPARDGRARRSTASQKPPPSAITTASQRRRVSASLMSPASTAHSMPLE